LRNVLSECEKYLPEICPRGMYFPVVEYECEDDMTVQFYYISFLDEKPVFGSGAMGFIVRPEQPADMPWLKLKTAVIQEPVPADTVTIEAEIFQIYPMPLRVCFFMPQNANVGSFLLANVNGFSRSLFAPCLQDLH